MPNALRRPNVAEIVSGAAQRSGVDDFGGGRIQFDDENVGMTPAALNGVSEKVNVTGAVHRHTVRTLMSRRSATSYAVRRYFAVPGVTFVPIASPWFVSKVSPRAGWKPCGLMIVWAIL